MSGKDRGRGGGSQGDAGAGGTGGADGAGDAGGGGLADLCQKAYRGVRLSSPKDLVLSKLKVGDLLNLEVREQRGSLVLYAVTESKEDAGTVISTSAVQIIRCIQAGYLYFAIVKVLNGANCTLEIRMQG
jgi:hypothetical protein